MIAVDTSALMAILLGEPDADICAAMLETEDRLLISAGTLAEALIVSGRRNVGEEMSRLIHGLGFEIVNLTAASARRVAETYEKWGRGVHSANLNFGDCFAYEVANEYGCPLLYVGDDFSQTDIRPAF